MDSSWMDGDFSEDAFTDDDLTTMKDKLEMGSVMKNEYGESISEGIVTSRDTRSTSVRRYS